MNGQDSVRFSIDHLTTFRYSEATQGKVMLVRLAPRTDRGQRRIEFALDVEPDARIREFQDSFGNSCHLCSIHRRHQQARIRSRTVVETAGAPGLPDRLDPGDWNVIAREKENLRFWHFLAPSRFAYRSAALDTFLARVRLVRCADPLASLRAASETLYESFHYTPGSTTEHSPIDHILETGQGVCQDYAHVMIAIGRNWGIPSRYVSGYLHLEGTGGGDGHEGASHAWAEFWLPGLGWTGLDPTHNLPVGNRHVRLAEGRDYADAAPTQGAIYGGGAQRLSVAVFIRDLAGGHAHVAREETDWDSGKAHAGDAKAAISSQQ